MNTNIPHPVILQTPTGTETHNHSPKWELYPFELHMHYYFFTTDLKIHAGVMR